MQKYGLWTIAVVWATTVPGTSALGQQVYRCGNTYSQSPCPGAAPVDVTDTRTSAQKAQTDAAAVQSAKLADQLEKERLAREKASAPKATAAPPKKQAALPANSKEKPAEKTAKGKKPAPEYFVAAAKPEKKEIKKAGDKVDGKEKEKAKETASK